MKRAWAMIALLLVVGCGGDDGDGDSTAKYDERRGRNYGMMHDSEMMHGYGMEGDMSAHMVEMNREKTAMLGAADSAYEMRFIDLMVHHHEGAVIMAEGALSKMKHAELKELAQKMVDAQRKEIDQMKGWRQQWYGDSTVAQMMPKGRGMNRMREMMNVHLGDADTGFDGRFIDVMIPHHQGAVLMAQDALGKASKPELKAMAQRIIEDRKKEIAQMEGWRKQWYGR